MMKVQCKDNKTYELWDDRDKLGEITYEGVMSFKAQLFVDRERYVVTPKGFFNTTMAVDYRGREIASMTMSWKGYIVISFEDGRAYRLKPIKPFYNQYALEDTDKQRLLLLHPDFQWSKLGYHFELSYEDKPEDILLVMLATYAAIFFKAGSSGEGY